MQHALIISETQDFIQDVANLVHHNGCAHGQRRKIQLAHPMPSEAKHSADTTKVSRDLMCRTPVIPAPMHTYPLQHTLICPVFLVLSRMRSMNMSCLSAEHKATRSLCDIRLTYLSCVMKGSLV